MCVIRRTATTDALLSQTGTTMTSGRLQHTHPRRSRLLAAMTAALACSLVVFSAASRGETRAISDTGDRSIRAFKVQVPQAALDDLRRRIKATRWPDRYRNLIYFNEVDKGGHFAAWEQPELFAGELRAAFRSLRSAN
jgi:pimeloyl-ACP methyl ester carboxylesterase